MEKAMKFEKLFTPGRIGNLTIKNRGVMEPMGSDFANTDGTASERLIRYYEARAKGGIGLIIVEFTGVDDVNSIPAQHQFRLARDYHITPAEQLTEAVHRHGALIFTQLHHAGSTSKAALTGKQALSASDVPFVPGAPVPKPMSIEEIHEVRQKFIDAALRAKHAGFDGVELHAAHSYLLGQFYSPYYNKRTDEYGGSLENRLRLIVEIVEGIKKAAPGFVVGVRINGDEMTPHIPETLNLNDGLEIGKHLERHGIDYLNVSNGSSFNANANCDPYSYQPGWKKHVAAAYKKALSIPIIATNTVKNPAFAEQLLEEGVSDFIGLARSQLADPCFMKKARQGREDEIRPCIGCMYCRERLFAPIVSIACAVNPVAGREYCASEFKRDGAGRQVVVVGGGPAGMEASRVLAERGFKVTLFEREPELGGTLILAAKPKFKNLITDFIKSLERQITLLGVDIRLNTEATPELVEKLKPVGVFVASGAEPIIPNIPGIDGKNVVTAEAVLRGEVQPKGRIAVIGTGLTGLETSETLLEQGGNTLTIVEMQPDVAPGIFAVIRNDLLGRINAFKPTILAGHKLTAIEDGKIVMQKVDDGSTVTADVDYVVLALGVRPRAGFAACFEAGCENVIAIGDALRGGRIREAMQHGYDRAYTFEP